MAPIKTILHICMVSHVKCSAQIYNEPGI
jgi:hypothetical protein